MRQIRDYFALAGVVLLGASFLLAPRAEAQRHGHAGMLYQQNATPHEASPDTGALTDNISPCTHRPTHDTENHQIPAAVSSSEDHLQIMNYRGDLLPPEAIEGAMTEVGPHGVRLIAPFNRKTLSLDFLPDPRGSIGVIEEDHVKSPVATDDLRTEVPANPATEIAPEDLNGLTAETERWKVTESEVAPSCGMACCASDRAPASFLDELSPRSGETSKKQRVVNYEERMKRVKSPHAESTGNDHD